MKFNNRGLFISFEGPEASGKSTQIKLLQKFFKNKKIPYILTREPGGTPVSEKLRKIILDKKQLISNTEEILLLMSSRLNHINTVIKPALKNGKIVITDRFADSTFVYQGFVNNYGLKKTMNLHKELLNDFLPSKTFLFLLSVGEINKRLKKRKITNKYDKIDTLFHSRVISGYKKLSKNNKRFIKINAELKVDMIHETVLKSIKELLK
ncbi:MAG: dTMP kinase [Pelagibacteraceae bacterium]|jgi:dTMP kinase|nr:dTMP kinase [Pelagibacteraceae bacterium]HJO13601.1 dTMP kinase [Alphaproteobacteria bacterium]MBO6466037.1 dTMP kinase [Pelagibacteraceae bacterium]MBO6468290.1 dTMP kinase [Pelagibacteraceae bacterium]MBO6470156.1 dTMP kinase [Pelagibacteraceae bacterium]|tara:strand:- start:51 stop:677 length:627 start_codon:yes stop_codon:yes gene_type:complete